VTTPRHLPRGWIVLGAILLVWLVVDPHPSLVIVVTLVAGMMIGAINGLLAARLRVAPFIATLGVRRAGWPML
jgi:erythritol transport system permease protein